MRGLLVGAIGASAVVLSAFVRHRRISKRSQQDSSLVTSGRLVVEDTADRELLKRSQRGHQSVRSLHLEKDAAHSFDGYVRPRSSAIVKIRVQPHCRLRVSLHDPAGSLRLRWTPGETGAASVYDEPNVLHERLPSESPTSKAKRKVMTYTAAAEEVVVHIAVVNTLKLQAVRFRLKASIAPVADANEACVAESDDSEEEEVSMAVLARKHLFVETTRELIIKLRVVRRLRSKLHSKKGRLSVQPPSHRLLEARAHAHDAVVWDELSGRWQLMVAEAQRCRAECRLWRDPDFVHDVKSMFYRPIAGHALMEQSLSSHGSFEDSSNRRTSGNFSRISRGTSVSHMASVSHTASASRTTSTTQPSETESRSSVTMDDVVWLSLRELLGQPHLWPDGRSSYLYAYERHAAEVAEPSQPGVIVQGSIGNCYFLSAVASTMADMRVRRDLIDESLEDAGIYGVSFFVRGRWRMVWVDSFFPCVPTSAPKPSGSFACDFEPLYASSKGEREAWLMVIEKAYAKLHRCYEALDGGQLAPALAMLTGGVARTELLHQADGKPLLSLHELHELLEDSLSDGFVGAGTPPAAEQLHGLVPGHAYAVLRLEKNFVLLRNPWGHSTFWKPADAAVSAAALKRLGSSRSALVARVMHGGSALGSARSLRSTSARSLRAEASCSKRPTSTEASCSRRPTSAGEFWMPLADFRSHFALFYACRVLPTTLEGGRWHFSVLGSQWLGITAGGCPNFLASWHHNPQLTIHVLRKTQLVLVLAQNSTIDDRPNRTSRAPEYPIGLVACRGGARLSSAPLRRSEVVAASKFLRASQVSLELEADAGMSSITIVPSTFEPGLCSKFMVYVYASHPVELRPHDADKWVYTVDETAGQLVTARRRRGGEGPRIVAPPPPMLQRFSSSFIAMRNSLTKRVSSQRSSSLRFSSEHGSSTDSIQMVMPSPASSRASPHLAPQREVDDSSAAALEGEGSLSMLTALQLERLSAQQPAPTAEQDGHADVCSGAISGGGAGPSGADTPTDNFQPEQHNKSTLTRFARD